MVSVIQFLTRLGGSIVELARIILVDVAVGDPLAFVNFLVGALVMAFSVGFLGYLALGALGRELGIVTPTPRRLPNERPPH